MATLTEDTPQQIFMDIISGEAKTVKLDSHVRLKYATTQTSSWFTSYSRVQCKDAKASQQSWGKEEEEEEEDFID